MDLTLLVFGLMLLAGLAIGVKLWRRSGREVSWLERIEAERRAVRVQAEPPR